MEKKISAENYIHVDFSSLFRELREKSVGIPSEEFRQMVHDAEMYRTFKKEQIVQKAKHWDNMPKHAQNFFRNYDGEPYSLYQTE